MPRVLRKNGESGHVADIEFEHSFVGTCVQRRSESAPDIHENRIDIILVAAFLIRAYLLVVLNLIEFARNYTLDGWRRFSAVFVC